MRRPKRSPPGGADPSEGPALNAPSDGWTVAGGGDGIDAAALATPPPPRSGSDLAQMAGDGAVKLIGNLVDGLLSFLLVVVITRGLGRHDSGAFFQAVALFMIISTLAKWGADTGLVRMVSRYRALDRADDLGRTVVVAMVPVFVAATIAAVVLFVFAPQLSEALTRRTNPGALVPYVRTLAPFLPLVSAYGLALAAVQGFRRMKVLVLIDNVGKSGLRPAFMVAVLALGLGAVAVSLAWAVPAALGLGAGIVWVRAAVGRERRRARRREAARPTAELASEFWRFTLPRGFASVFGTMITWLDTLLLGALASSASAGVYVAATRCLKFGTVALVATQFVISPQISALLARSERDRAQSVYRAATSWLVIPSWPIFIGLAVFAPFVLRVFGRGFGPGSTALTILSVAMLVSMATGPVSAVLMMGGHSMWNLVNTLGALVLNVGLNLILIPRLGITGAAISWAVSIVANNLAALVEVRLLMGLGPLGSGFWTVAAASGLCYGVLGVLMRVTLGLSAATFVAWGVLASAAYAAIVWRYRDRLELQALWAGLVSRVRRPAGGGRPSLGTAR